MAIGTPDGADRLIMHGNNLISYGNKILAEQPAIIRSGLVLYLDASDPESFSEDSPGTWFDLSGQGNHCVLTDNPALHGDALEFNGTTQMGTITASTSLNFGVGDFTLLATTTHPSQPGGATAGCIAYKGARFDANQRGYLFMSHAGSNQYHVVSDGASRTEYITNPVVTLWSNSKVYGFGRRAGRLIQITDGVVTNTGVISTLNIDSPNDLTIAFNDHYNHYWQGEIKNILFYNRALTDQELLHTYQIIS